MNGDVLRDSAGKALTRQDQLLLLVNERCKAGPTGRYYVPRYGVERVYLGKELLDIGMVAGAGDRHSLNALKRKGLIEEVLLARRFMGYRITEAGMLKAQEII